MTATIEQSSFFSLDPSSSHPAVTGLADDGVPIATQAAMVDEAPPHCAMGSTPLTVWGTSLVIHIAVLLLSSAIYFTVESQPPLPVLTTVIDDIDHTPLSQELTQELDVSTVDPDAPVTEAAKSVAETASQRQVQEQQLNPLVDDTMPPDPLAFAIRDADLAEILEGVQGDIVHTDGDVGSVDRITQEIVNRLREKKVVVAWLMDASESLSARREQVITRFERVYAELDELARGHEDLLLTSVMAFGQQTVVMTKEPTADRKAIQKAVRDIAVDESGVENVFSAIRTTALDHRSLSRKGYDVMIVVLTDECGNDFDILEDALQQVQRYSMSVFVMGPMAPFGQHEVNVPWTNPTTKEVHRLPVERGPESIRVESPKLPSWNEKLRNIVMSSGFGSFGLARMTRESGGIYFLHRDENIAATDINFTGILNHSPDYVSAKEYMNIVRRNPARQAVLSATDVSHQANWKQPQTKFLESGIQFDIRDSQGMLMKISQFLDQSIEELRAVEKSRQTESSQRWRAHYDLLMGRLLAGRVRLNNSIPLLNEMYTKPKVCRDGTTNAWELAGREDSVLRQAQTSGSEEAGPNGDVKHTSKTTGQNDAALARAYLQRVEAEHPGTPWSALARLELDSAVDFQWREAFMIPPDGEKLPWDRQPWDELSDRQKEAKRKFERFQIEKKMKEEQQAREAESSGKKVTKIPKL